MLQRKELSVAAICAASWWTSRRRRSCALEEDGEAYSNPHARTPLKPGWASRENLVDVIAGGSLAVCLPKAGEAVPLLCLIS
eukprot:7357998-Pyramimonas_sp.AAC.1